jgi:hypothetical protein
VNNQIRANRIFIVLIGLITLPYAILSLVSRRIYGPIVPSLVDTVFLLHLEVLETLRHILGLLRKLVAHGQSAFKGREAPLT